MKRRFRFSATSWHIGLITLLGTPLISPLLRATAVPCTHDGHLHYHRIAAMRYAWENGLFFTRWLPDLAFGYGYPFFVYREPAPLYAGLVPHLLGMPLPAASNLFYALCILSGGWFMYLWVRDLFGVSAGMMSAVAYMATPYVLVDSLIRGNAPESLALALFPLLMWSGRRWLLGGTAVFFLISTLGLALLSLSHNISLLLFAPTLLVYLAVLAWIQKLPGKTAVLRLLLLFGLGLGMTIFYSGGALLELDQVTLEQSTVTRNNDFHYNFTTLTEIFSAVSAENPSLVNPPLPFRLGWVPAVLALTAIVLSVANRKLLTNNQQSKFDSQQRIHIWLMVAATAVFLFLSLPASLFFWENVPLVDFIQFPWRMVGRAALPVAFLAGVPFGLGVSRVPNAMNREPKRGWLRPLLLSLAVVFLVAETIPNLYPNSCTEEGFPTINTVHRYEHETGLVGVDPEGSYFPRTVQKRPSASPLERAYQTQSEPMRLDVDAFPAGTAIHMLSTEPLSASAAITAPEAFTAVYRSFDFPGWSATVDGEHVPITPGVPDGLITFPVPAGEHEIAVRWQSTPTRSLLVAISLFALAGTAVTAFVVSKEAKSVSRRSFSNNQRLRNTNHGLRTTACPLLLTALLLIGAKWFLFDHIDTLLRHMAAPEVASAISLQAGELRLDGFNVSQTAVSSGGTFDIDLAWTAVDFPQADYQSNVWLVDANGLIWSDKETYRPRSYEDAPRTRAWQPGQWGWDSREITVFSGTPPGSYDIVVTLFDLNTLQPLTIATEEGQVLGAAAVIGQIEVMTSTVPEPLQPQIGLTAVLPETGLSLLGYHQDRNEAAPGELILLTLYWKRQSPQPVDTFVLQLVQEDGTVVQTWPQQTAVTDLSDWSVNDEMRGQYLVRFAAGLANGRYEFVLQDGIELGAVEIIAPDRLFVQPVVETPMNVPFSENNTPLATLIGYTLNAPINNPTLSLNLLWQANHETSTSYRVFVHLLDENGTIIAQSDGEPANWARPTTGWAAGEYIIDIHSLARPETAVAPQLRIGLYDPKSNYRLHTETADAVTIDIP